MKRNLILLMVATVMACSTPNPTHGQTTWPAMEQGTVLTQTDVVTGLYRPWEILWGQDDYIWCTQRNGKVLHIDPLTGNYTTILDKSSVIPGDPTAGDSEPGMLGMCLHPQFPDSNYVFIVYNYEAGNSIEERLSCFQWDGTNLVNEQIFIDDIPGYWIHDGSRIILDATGKLMMTTGDTGDGGDSSQDMDALNGKVLRINLDGSIPADNPDPASYVWSFGHRNAQGLCLGPDGIIYSSEHGQSNSDEFNIIEPNRNYGWPTVQGACNTSSEQTYCDANDVKEPLMEWSPCVAVNGIEYYNHPAIPEWQNSILMSVMGGLSGTGGNNDRVSVLHLSSDYLTIESENKYFSTLNQRFRDVCINPYTGAVYVALNGTSYPGQGQNKIIEFRNMAYNAVQEPAITVGQDISIYPNPAGDTVTLEASTSIVGTTVQIYTFNGVLVKEVKVESQKQSLDISTLATGNYWVLATNSIGSTTCEFFKP
ncbi:MAG: PQQ-dependent sugar dehydrogenase [Flavobacteriales bacterium]